MPPGSRFACVLNLDRRLKGMFGDLTTQEDRDVQACLLREIWCPGPIPASGDWDFMVDPGDTETKRANL